MTGVRRALILLLALALTGPAQVACGRTAPPATRAPTPAVTPSAGTTPTPGTPTPATTGSTPRPARTHSPPAPAVPPSLAGRDIERVPTDRKVVALTFDAGANADGVPAILAALDRDDVSATFFLTGTFARQFPDAARSIARAGHRLGNHSVTHPHFPALTDAQVRAQLTGAETAVRSTAGATTRPFFRFPFGDRTAHTIAVVNAAGYVAVRWTVDSLGWQGTSGGRSAASVTGRVLGAAQPGEIVLLHVGSHPSDRSTLDADALPGIIRGLRQRGYTFVTLDALR